MILNIKEQLNKVGFSRYELAKRIGVTYPTIDKIYKGKSTSIKFEILEALCKELDCTPNDIVISNVDATTQKIEHMKSLCPIKIEETDDSFLLTTYLYSNDETQSLNFSIPKNGSLQNSFTNFFEKKYNKSDTTL